MKILKKNQFTDDGSGNLVKGFHIEPKDDNQVIRDLEKGETTYESSDTGVATAEKNPDDEKKFNLVWKGPGRTIVTAKGDADLDEGEDNFISGTEEFKLEEDEATSIVIVED